MLDTRRLKAPLEIQEKVVKEAERVRAFIRGRKMRLSDEQVARIEKDLDKKINAWKTQTGPMRRKLVRLNDLLEGVVEETNFPFEGASNITLHYAAGMARTFKATFNRTVYQNPNIFLARVPTGAASADLDTLQEGVNYTFQQECNGLDTLKTGTIPCFRDGKLIVAGHWERSVEMANDSRIYASPQEFMKDYPDADSAGVDQEAYDAILDAFIVDPDHELRVDFQYDYVAQDCPEYEIIPLASFPFWPTYVPSIRRMEMYGRRYLRSESELLSRAKSREFWQEKVDEVLATNRGISVDEWHRSKNFAEGIMPQKDDKKAVELMDLVYKTDLDNDGYQEKYLLTFATESKKLLCIEYYPLRRNVDFCVDGQFLKREDRFLPPSLLGDAEDLFNQMDSLHRHRNNVRMIAAGPVLVANKTYKEQIDLGRAENVMRPGVTFWVDDINSAVKQLQLQNLDQPGNSLDEENILVRYIELAIGPTQGLSGRETPSDPKAPMGKTLALMNQANQRIDDYIDEFMKMVPALAELHVTLYHQYGPKEGVRFNIDRDGRPAAVTVDKRLWGMEGVRWLPRKRSVTFSPEFAMQRIGGLMAVYGQLFPLLVQNDPRAIEMWNRMVLASGEPDVQKLLWTSGQAPANLLQSLQAPQGPSAGPPSPMKPMNPLQVLPQTREAAAGVV